MSSPVPNAEGGLRSFYCPICMPHAHQLILEGVVTEPEDLKIEDSTFRKPLPVNLCKHERAMCDRLLFDIENNEDSLPFLSEASQSMMRSHFREGLEPMDFNLIGIKLENSGYSSANQFVMDVETVFDNCEHFFGLDSVIGRMGARLKTFVQERWIEIINFGVHECNFQT